MPWSKHEVTFADLAAALLTSQQVPVLDVTTDLAPMGFPNAVAGVDGGGDAIQHAIDLFIAQPGRWSHIYLPPDLTFRTTSPLRVMSQVGFCTVHMVSSPKSMPLRDWPVALRGARIELRGDNPGELPVLIVQGGRACTFKGLQFVNTGNVKPREIAEEASLLYGIFNYPTLADWVTVGARDNTYSPCCCVAIDPFMSEYPDNNIANAYPTMTDYYGGSALTSPVASSATKFEGCAFEGAVVSIAMSPPGPAISASNTLNNNENTKFVDCHMQYSAIHFSSGQSQERCTELRGCSLLGSWLTFDNEYVGPGGNPGNAPKLTGATNIGGTRYVFNLQQNETFDYRNIYVESAASIGKLGTGVASAAGGCVLQGSFTLATAASVGLNKPEVEYHLCTYNMVSLDNVHLHVADDGPLKIWNQSETAGRLLMRFCRINSKAVNDHVPCAFSYDDAGLVVEHSRTRNTAGSAVFNTDATAHMTVTAVNANAIVQVATTATEHEGTVEVASTTGIEVGMIVRYKGSSPTTWTPQTLSPSQFAYAFTGPIGVVSAITVDTSFTITGLPFGFPFSQDVRLDLFSWDNSGGTD